MDRSDSDSHHGHEWRGGRWVFSVSLPVSLNGSATARLRFYAYNGPVSVGNTGSRPKISIDNITVASAPPALSTGLIGRWTMEGNTNDVSGNGFNATQVGGPTYGLGVDGQALKLSGTGQYASVADNAQLSPTGAITLAGWIKCTKAAVATQRIIQKGVQSSNNGYELSMSSAGQIFVRFNQLTSGDTYRINSTTSYPLNGSAWMHAAATFDGATIRLYVNGVEEGALAMAVPIGTNTSPLTIGAMGNATNLFQGTLDDARLYNRALGPGEIAALADLPTQTITASAGPNGSIGPDGVVLVRRTANQAFTITPNPGYGVADVVVDGTTHLGAVTTYTFTNVTADHTISATFVAVAANHTITASAGTGGSISPSGAVTVADGANQSFTITPSVGYHVDDVVVDGTTHLGPVTTHTFNTVTTDHSIAASFAENPPVLVGRWSMEGNLNDVSGNGLNASPTGGPTFGAGIEGAQALVLNGAAQYGLVPTNAQLDMANKITLAAWVKPGAKAGPTNVLARAVFGTGASGFELNLGSTGKPFVRFNVNDTFRVNGLTSYPTDGSWMHLAATYDGTTIKLYVNGVLDNSVASTFTIGNAGQALGIGAQSDGLVARLLQGSIDDARIYNYALTPTDVAALASHSLTVTAVGSGTVSKAPTDQPTYTHGTVVTLTANPAVGSHFVSWSGGATGSTSPTAVTMDGDKAVTATFAVNVYSLAYLAGANGSISGVASQSVNHGASGTPVTAVPDPGFHFVDWSDAVTTATRTETNVTANLTVTANFAADTPTTTALASNNNPSTFGASVTLTATVTPIPPVGGTVTFLDNGSSIGAGTTDGGGIATLATSTLAVGSHPLTARFEGDATHAPSTSTPALSQVVNTAAGANTVNVGAASGMITQGNPVRVLPVTISRTDATPIMAFSVTFAVSSELAVAGGTGGIHEGSYLSTANPTTTFYLIDLGTDGGGNHSYEVDGTTLDSPCGSSAASGTLFTIDVSAVAAGGSGTVTITDLKLRDCTNADLPTTIGTSSSIAIDQSAPVVHVIAPNGGETWPTGSLQTISWTGSDPEGLTSFDLAYSTNGGASYPNAIATVPGTETSFAWTVPSTPGTAIRVRVTGHDVNGNTAADASDPNFTIGCPLITVTAATTPVACYGGSTGAIDISVSGGTPAYTYAWGDGPTSEDRTGLAPARYTVTVTDANGCTGGLNVPVTEPAALAADRDPRQRACFGGATGSIDLTVTGGTGAYTYAWSDGATTEDRSGLAAGSYIADRHRRQRLHGEPGRHDHAAGARWSRARRHVNVAVLRRHDRLDRPHGHRRHRRLTPTLGRRPDDRGPQRPGGRQLHR